MQTASPLSSLLLSSQSIYLSIRISAACHARHVLRLLCPFATVDEGPEQLEHVPRTPQQQLTAAFSLVGISYPVSSALSTFLSLSLSISSSLLCLSLLSLNQRPSLTTRSVSPDSDLCLSSRFSDLLLIPQLLSLGLSLFHTHTLPPFLFGILYMLHPVTRSLLFSLPTRSPLSLSLCVNRFLPSLARPPQSPAFQSRRPPDRLLFLCLLRSVSLSLFPPAV